jgi:hypothetical protein
MAADEETEGQGTSLKKKVATTVAVGIATTAAAGAAKKLLGGDENDGDKDKGREAASKSFGERRQERRVARSARAGKTTSRRAAKKTAGGAKSTASKSASKTKEQLYKQAKRLKIQGRSSMTKGQLERALRKARS